MRTLLITAVLLSSIVAGCTSKTDSHDDTFTCPDGTILDLEDYADHDNATFNATSKCPPLKGGLGNSTSNSTNEAPNLAPVLIFKVTDAGGNATNFTTLSGAVSPNLTFSGQGTVDSDGQITGMAMSITDASGTRTESLFDATTSTFLSVPVNFTKPGIINVSVAVVDDRGGFATLDTQVFVDHVQVVSASLQSANPAAAQSASAGPPCKGPSATAVPPGPVSGDAVDNSYFAIVSFDVTAQATWIEVKTATAGTAWLSICAPPIGTATPVEISKARHATAVVTKDNIQLPPALGITKYGVGVYRTGTASAIPLTVTVHYAPKA